MGGHKGKEIYFFAKYFSAHVMHLSNAADKGNLLAI